MQVTARLRYLHMSPRKVRRIADILRGLPVLRAQAELAVRIDRAALPLRKLLDSAVANARTMSEASPEDMEVAAIFVDGGPTTKRFRPRSRGTAHPVARRTSHVTVTLQIPDEKRRVARKTIAAGSKPGVAEQAIPPVTDDGKAPLGEHRDAQSYRQSEREQGVSPRRVAQGFAKRFFQRKSV